MFLSFWLILLSFCLLAVLFSLGHSPGNTPLDLLACLLDSGPSGLFHLVNSFINGTGAAAGLLRNGAAPTFLLGQFLFQFSRHNTAGLLLDWLTTLPLALVLDFVPLFAFSYFCYKNYLLLKNSGRTPLRSTPY